MRRAVPLLAALALGAAGRAASAPSSVTIGLSLPDTTVDRSDVPAQVPLTVAGFDGIGAVSLHVAYADSVLEPVQVVSAVPGVSFTWSAAGSEVTIDWQDGTGENPLHVGTGTLLFLEVFVIGESGEISPLDFTPACALADSAGNPIPGVVFVDGSCTVGVTLAAGQGTTGDAARLVLDASRPNPFRATTAIRYEVPREGPVTLQVLDVGGRRIRTLEDARKGPGRYAAAWNGRDDAGARVAPGVYLVRLESADRTATRKVVLVR